MSAVIAVVLRFLLCWGCVALLALFVFCSVLLTIAVSFDEPFRFNAQHLVVTLFLLAVVLGAINVPLVWAIGYGLSCALWRDPPRYLRYGLALVLGLVGAFTLYYEFRYEFPTIARIGWSAEPLTRLFEWSAASLTEAERFSQGQGLTYLLGVIANLVCVTSAVAPLLATYIDNRRSAQHRRG